MAKGWIKLHRAIEEHPRFKDAKWLQVWIKCLVLATHQAYKTTFNGKVITLNPGQFITSRKSLAVSTGTQESKVERILKTLEIEQQIEQVGGAVSRLISILKWDDYQNGEQENEQQLNNDRTTIEQRVNTNKNDKNKRRRVRAVLADVDPAHLPPAKPDPENLDATRSLIKRFQPPTLEEVTEYCQSRKSSVDPATWWTHYDAKGWMIGSNKMVKWKSAIATWEHKNAKSGNNRSGSTPYQSAADKREEANAEFLRDLETRRNRRGDPADVHVGPAASPEIGFLDFEA